MLEENKQLIRRWFEEVWNNGRSEAIPEMFAEDGIAHGLGNVSSGELRGPADFQAFHRNFREAFPDISVSVEETIAEGDMVAARCLVRGQHMGGTLGFAATQKPMEISGIAIVRIRDGKIVEAWNNFDFMSLYQQLGVM